MQNKIHNINLTVPNGRNLQTNRQDVCVRTFIHRTVPLPKEKNRKEWKTVHHILLVVHIFSRCLLCHTACVFLANTSLLLAHHATHTKHSQIFFPSTLSNVHDIKMINIKFTHANTNALCYAHSLCDGSYWREQIKSSLNNM